MQQPGYQLIDFINTEQYSTLPAILHTTSNTPHYHTTSNTPHYQQYSTLPAILHTTSNTPHYQQPVTQFTQLHVVKYHSKFWGTISEYFTVYLLSSILYASQETIDTHVPSPQSSCSNSS